MNENPLLSDDAHGRLQVVHVLLLFQASAGLLSGAAMLLFMGGNPLAFPIAIGVPIFLLVLAAGVSREWRWSRKGSLVIQWLLLLAFALSILLGFLQPIDFTFNLMSILTNLVIPISIIRLLRAGPAVAVAFQRDDARAAA